LHSCDFPAIFFEALEASVVENDTAMLGCCHREANVSARVIVLAVVVSVQDVTKIQ
jgi:hypothetical protein